MHRFSASAALAAAVTFICPQTVRAGNQTNDLSPLVVGGNPGLLAQILPETYAGPTLPAMNSFAKAQYNGQWLIIGGLSAGMHDLDTGFDPAHQNSEVFVIDPATQQMWHRSLYDATSGLGGEQVDSLSVTNSQFTQIGSRLYIAGGFGNVTGTEVYKTYNFLSAIDLPGMIDWVKGGPGAAASHVRQTSDALFEVTGGEMVTNTNGKTHLIFGQAYPGNYSFRLDGKYTKQVRSFEIVDDGSSVSYTNVIIGAEVEDYRRRDLNAVPIIQKVGGQLVEKTQVLSGVFTIDNGAWTVPVTIDAAGNATEPDPLAPGTFKQGFNGYKCATVGLYSASTDTMHTLLFGGISFQYYDSVLGAVASDPQLPFIHDATDIVTDSAGNMTQFLLPAGFPTMVDAEGDPLFLGTETEFFLKPGIATYANGVIDLDALTGPTVVGYFFGGIASDKPNGGKTRGSNGLFPLVITPVAVVPEPGTLGILMAVAGMLMRRRRSRSPSVYA